MTAPSDEALRRDIELSLSAGFNGARLHQKLVEERYLYHADRLGFLIWGEFPDWVPPGSGHTTTVGPRGPTYIMQGLEALERDYSHPSIVGWCPLKRDGPAPRGPPGHHRRRRSGNVPGRERDGCHPAVRCRCHTVGSRSSLVNSAEPGGGQSVSPTMGTATYRLTSHGDTVPVRSRSKPFYARFDRLSSVLLDNPRMFRYCYTRFTDVCQDANGIFTFDRRPKFHLARLRATQCRPAAAE